jgi:hypothetical protein
MNPKGNRYRGLPGVAQFTGFASWHEPVGRTDRQAVSHTLACR